MYVDASIIAGLVLGDLDAELTFAVLGRGELSYSRFGYGEAVAASSARARATGLDDLALAGLAKRLGAFLAGWREVPWADADLDRAIDLCGRASLAIKLPDAIHVAVAERLGIPLATGDRQQHRAARIIGLDALLVAMTKGKA
jgi:uncharacterized protein